MGDTSMGKLFASVKESRELSSLSDEIDRLEILLAKELATNYAKRLRKGTCGERAWEMWCDKYYSKYFNQKLGIGGCGRKFIETWMYAFRYIHPICKDKNCYCCDDPSDSDGIHRKGVFII